ncbi:hypothetical protein BOSE62_80231 [Bosea sp. 62]|nr:hypothetical protein BOSE46_20446 [Bosea sp. 46]VXC67751.1 hypothetical protein BOSE125_30594 [Bosea sp. 125]VXC97762.1 hypothetical protein BOSE62_80231 [Bosea sp. 62]
MPLARRQSRELEARIALSAVSSEHLRQFVCLHLRSRFGMSRDLADVPRPVGDTTCEPPFARASPLARSEPC